MKTVGSIPVKNGREIISGWGTRMGKAGKWEMGKGGRREEREREVFAR